MQSPEESGKTPQPANVFLALLGRLKEHPLARLGPGLITGVADDDPSGIATYSQAGAQFGLNMLWTMPLAYPLMAAIQSMCAQIGRVTGKGLRPISGAFPPIVLKGVVLLLLIANTLNIAADVAAMGEVAELVSGFDRHLMTAVFVVATLLLQIFVPYHRYVFFLKWLTLSLLAYAAVLFTVQVPWGEVGLRTVWPKLTLNFNTAAMVVGIFGTTISPYLFFWQASEEVEDMHAKRSVSFLQNPDAAPSELRRIQWDTWSGMFLFGPYGLFHYPGDRGHAQRVRNYRHRNRSPGGERAAAAGRRFCLSPVCGWNPWRRLDRGAGTRRFGRLCAVGSNGLAIRA